MPRKRCAVRFKKLAGLAGELQTERDERDGPDCLSRVEGLRARRGHGQSPSAFRKEVVGAQGLELRTRATRPWLSDGFLATFAFSRGYHETPMFIGRRGWTRTSDPLLRRQVLYPPELRAREQFPSFYLRLTAFSNSAAGSVFITSAGSNHPLRAVITP